MIRATVRLILFIAVIDVILRFSFVTVLMVKKMDYNMASGFFDSHPGANFMNTHYKVSYSVGFYLSVFAAVISVGCAFGAPLAASR